MNILFYRYNSICEPDFIDAFRRAGVTVIEQTEEITCKNISGKELVENVSNTLLKTPCLFAISINYYPALSSVCGIFHIPYLSIVVDSPLLELYSDTIKNPWNRIFIFDRKLYSKFNKYNPSCIFHMPLSANVDHMDRVCAKISASDKKCYGCDVSFIGSLYKEKSPLNQIAALSEPIENWIQKQVTQQLSHPDLSSVYDSLTDTFVADFKRFTTLYSFPESFQKDEKEVIASQYIGVKVSEIERINYLKAVSEQFFLHLYTGSDTSDLPHAHCKGFAKSQTQMPKIFHLSKINLQITARTIETGLSQRVFDVLAANGFLLMNDQPELSDYFKIGTDLDIFTSKEELLDKISFYLSHEDLRCKIAKSGYEKVKKYHSTDKRILEYLNHIG